MIKKISIIIVIVLFGFSLASCGGSSDSPSSDEDIRYDWEIPDAE